LGESGVNLAAALPKLDPVPRRPGEFYSDRRGLGRTFWLRMPDG